MIDQGRVKDALEQITPSEMFNLAAAWWAENKQDAGVFAAEARRLEAESPEQINYRASSRALGTPKPTLANSYQPELLNIRTFPTLMGYSSRIMAESWESNILYNAALADELHMLPSQLNVVVPEWTQSTVEKIFATHLDSDLTHEVTLNPSWVRNSDVKPFAVQHSFNVNGGAALDFGDDPDASARPLLVPFAR